LSEGSSEVLALALVQSTSLEHWHEVFHQNSRTKYFARTLAQSILLEHFQIIENTTFRKLDLFPSSGEGRESSTLLGLLDSVCIREHKQNSLLHVTDTPIPCTLHTKNVHQHSESGHMYEDGRAVQHNNSSTHNDV
jgi:hypothetical protein